MIGRGVGDIDSFLGKGSGKITEEVETKTLLDQHVKNLEQDREERKKYALWTFVFLCSFTSTILLIIILSGLSAIIPFSVSENVLITLITTSLTTVISIFIFVMRYLFNK